MLCTDSHIIMSWLDSLSFHRSSFTLPPTFRWLSWIRKHETWFAVYEFGQWYENRNQQNDFSQSFLAFKRALNLPRRHSLVEPLQSCLYECFASFSLISSTYTHTNARTQILFFDDLLLNALNFVCRFVLFSLFVVIVVVTFSQTYIV